MFLMEAHGGRRARRTANAVAQRLHIAGFEDAPPLTPRAFDGIHPRGRELSLAWLAGTVMTGLTSVLLMGGALYVSFQGQGNFSTAARALQLQKSETSSFYAASMKGDRLRPLSRTRSNFEVIQASIREVAGGRSIIRSEQFARVDATLAVMATPLAGDIPDFDPAVLIASLPETNSRTSPEPTAEIYSANVEGEVAFDLRPMPVTLVPPRAIADREAADFALLALQDVFVEEGANALLAYSPQAPTLSQVGVGSGPMGIAENVTIVPKMDPTAERGGRSERVVTVSERATLEELLLKNGFTASSYEMVAATLSNILPEPTLPAGAKLRILMGPSRSSPTPIPYRLSIYVHEPATKAIRHAATAALTDKGRYVIGLEPGKIEFPDEDTEAVDVHSLPSLYRSIWETARKLDIDDMITARVVAMFAYELDLTQKVVPGDGLKLLTTRPDKGTADLLYAALTTGTTARELFRFQNEDGEVDFYSPDGETGKRFLTRRPLQGGGRLTSRWGYRIHPILKSRRLHAGVDLAAPRGVPIYAGGDGVVKRAQWMSGYGRYVELDHVNGYQTAYAHMDRIADGLKAGQRVKQGQIIGYVGATGNVTGNHLHYEMRVNGRSVDPLSVKLPRDKELPPQSQQAFAQVTAQIREIMSRDEQEQTK